MSAPKKISQDLDYFIKLEYAKGIPPTDIAANLGLSVPTIYLVLRGYPKPPTPVRICKNVMCQPQFENDIYAKGTGHELVMYCPNCKELHEPFEDKKPDEYMETWKRQLTPECVLDLLKHNIDEFTEAELAQLRAILDGNNPVQSKRIRGEV